MSIFQLQPGRACRLEADQARWLAPGPIHPELLDALTRRGLRLPCTAQLRDPRPGTWEIADFGIREVYRIVEVPAIPPARHEAAESTTCALRGPAGLDVLVPARFEGRRVRDAIATYARRSGREPTLLRPDGQLSAEAQAALLDAGAGLILKLIDFNPHVVGLRLEADGFDETCRLIGAVRLFSAAEVVLGGPTATSHPSDVLQACGADYVFAGEAEETFAQFLRLARSRDSVDCAVGIPGLAYRYGGRVLVNAPPGDGYGQACPHDVLRPAADRDLIAANRLDWSLLEGFRRPLDSLYFTGGRGCPGECTFCSKLHGQEVRVKSASQLLEEIAGADALVAEGRLPVTCWPLFEHVDDPALRGQRVAWAAIYDEDFFLHRRRAIEFFRLWEQSCLRERYRLSVQTNPCTLLDGCGQPHGDLFQWIDRLKPMIQLGAESFNAEVLARWHKRHNVIQLQAVLDALDRTGQDYTLFALLTDFQTTAEELMESLRLLVLTALQRPRMRIASSPYTIPLYDSDARKMLDFGGRLPRGAIRDFRDYERPRPDLMDPLVADLADLADAELRFALVPQHRDAALNAVWEAVVQRLQQEQSAAQAGRVVSMAPARLARLIEQGRAAEAQARQASFRAPRTSER